SMPRVVDLITSPPLARARLGSMKRASDSAQRALDRVAVVEPRPSASVILVRDGTSGLETFMVRRHARSPVAPSAYVFPGGTIRADDLEFEPELDREGLAQAISVRADTPVEPTQAAAFYVSALRELFEEAGVLLARDAAGGVLNVSDSDTSLKERLESTRLALQAQ